jgi:hypothetical protein
MADDHPSYVCPQCGGLILNRGYPKCEHCQADLPAQLLFSKAEMDKNWAAYAAAQQRDADQRLRDAITQFGGDGVSNPPTP